MRDPTNRRRQRGREGGWRNLRRTENRGVRRRRRRRSGEGLETIFMPVEVGTWGAQKCPKCPPQVPLFPTKRRLCILCVSECSSRMPPLHPTGGYFRKYTLYLIPFRSFSYFHSDNKNVRNGRMRHGERVRDK